MPLITQGGACAPERRAYKDELDSETVLDLFKDSSIKDAILQGNRFDWTVKTRTRATEPNAAARPATLPRLRCLTWKPPPSAPRSTLASKRQDRMGHC